ncbi:PLP-dependent aminotransferase family protein [Lachnospiraceae bacterium JLR.KK008]
MNDLVMELDSRSGRHLYEQIYDHIRQEIREGKLRYQEKLPSTRFLAEYLQVSRSTVDLAYGQLLSEGYIESRPYKGFFVCKIEELYDLECRMERRSESDEAEQPRFRYDFSPNVVELGSFPFGTWKKITKEMLTDDRKELFALGHPQGDRELRSTICHYLHTSRGVNCRPQQIIIGAGNDYLLLLLEKILGGRRKVALENPTYKRAYRIFCSFAYEVKMVPMDESGMRVDLLEESGADLAYVMPSHQFPMGIVMPIGRRLELLRWASSGAERYLIEDDYDSEFRYRGKPVPSLQASDKAGRVIYIGTFSKAIAPAIRVSYMVLPESLLERYRSQCMFFSSTVSRLDQSVLHEFIRDGAFERHLNKMRKIYKSRHDRLLLCCKKYLNHVTVSGENAGLHLLLHCHGGKTEQELLRLAAERDMKLYGMSDTYIGRLPEDWQPTLILGYAGLHEDEIESGVRILSDCI